MILEQNGLIEDVLLVSFDLLEAVVDEVHVVEQVEHEVVLVRNVLEISGDLTSGFA